MTLKQWILNRPNKNDSITDLKIFLETRKVNIPDEYDDLDAFLIRTRVSPIFRHALDKARIQKQNEQ